MRSIKKFRPTRCYGKPTARQVHLAGVEVAPVVDNLETEMVRIYTLNLHGNSEERILLDLLLLRAQGSYRNQYDQDSQKYASRFHNRKFTTRVPNRQASPL